MPQASRSSGRKVGTAAESFIASVLLAQVGPGGAPEQAPGASRLDPAGAREA
jgi:hypothetical protein